MLRSLRENWIWILLPIVVVGIAVAIAIAVRSNGEDSPFVYPL